MTTLTDRDPLDTMFDEFFSDMCARPAWLPTTRVGAMTTVARSRMDVVDKGGTCAFTVDMPGVMKENIDVAIEGAHIAVNPQRGYETPVTDGEKLPHSERYAASYARTCEPPAAVTESGAVTIFANGVLTLTAHKRAPVATRRIEIL